MGIEQKINQKLNQHPGIKKTVKRVYQRTMYAVSPRIKSEGKIERVSPDDPDEYFFGYYDKCPEDTSGRYVLCLKAEDTWSEVAPTAPASILLVDTQKEADDPQRIRSLATTHTWNTQQGCMMQWLGPEYDHKILFNDYRNGEYLSVILDIFSGEEKLLKMPVYSVAADGSFALTLDFSRLHRLRPGYGYSNIPDKTKDEKLPASTAVWKLDLRTNTVSSVLSYADLAGFEPRAEMENAVHKVNHLMIRPDGKRFMFLHRWFDGQRKYSRLLTANTDGSDLFNLSDDDMVSHCCWKNNKEILAFENKKEYGTGYYLMEDETHNYQQLWPSVKADGHPSYSPDGCCVVTDTYPNRSRIAEITIMQGVTVNKAARVFAPFRYDNETRCDLHPRWSRDGKKVYFDSVSDGRRRLYSLDTSEYTFPIPEDTKTRKEPENPTFSVITPVYNSFSLMTRYFNSFCKQTYDNFELIIVDDSSTDGSYEKLCEYSKTVPLSVRVYQTAENGGPGLARNLGMEMARGEWITFVDNDDWVETSFLHTIEETLQKTQADAVIYDYYTTNGFKSSPAKSMYKGTTGFVSLSECVRFTRNHTFGKFYRRAKCKDIRFPPIRRCEDVAFVDRALAACGNVYYLNKPFYYYYRRPTSLSNNTQLGAADMINAFSIIEKELGDKYPDEVKEKSVSDILYGALLIMCKSNKPNGEIKKYIEDYEKKYPGWEKTEIMNYLGKEKKVFLLFAKMRNIRGMKAIAKVHSKIISG